MHALTLTLALALAASAAAIPHHAHQRFHERSTSSGKRGLAFNDASLTSLFSDSGSKVSWMYNWASSANGNTAYEFVPMLHDNTDSSTSTWSANAKTAISNGAKYAMSVNEPDQCGSGSGGACMQDVATTVAFHKQYMQPLAGQVKIGAPAVTNGVKDSSTGSVMGLPWLKEFMSQCDGCTIDFVSIHWYGLCANAEDFKQHVQDAYTAGGNRPVWVTEFAPTDGSDDDKATFLKTVLSWLDEQDYVDRYSYQMAAKEILVNSAGNALTTLGSTYNTA